MENTEITEQAQSQTILFENKYEFTKEKIKKWNSVRPKNSGGLIFGYHIFLLMFTAAYLTLGLVLLIVYGRLFNILTVTIAAALIIHILLKNTLECNREQKRIMRLSKDGSSNVFFRFYEDRIEVADFSGASAARPYDHIIFMREQDDIFRLLLEDRCWIICKNCFTIGDAEAFGEFIRNSCAQSKPLLSNKQHNLRIIKGLMFSTLLIVAVSVVCFPWLWSTRYSGSVRYESFESTVALYEENVQVIAALDSEKLSGGAIIFFAEEPDDVGASLYKQATRDYLWVDTHVYSITGLNRWSQQGGALFESQDDLLEFAAGDWSVVYGVVEKWWWETVSDSEKSQYTAVEFEFGAKDFVLYYKIHYKEKKKNV
jgi:hypothetical protein